MYLGSKKMKNETKEYIIRLTEREYQRLINGETLKHITACANIGGVWNVSFTKFSQKELDKFLC